MTDNEIVTEIFRNKEYMTQEQLNIADEFQNMVEAEYALCALEMKKSNKAAVSGATYTNSNEKLSVNYACLEIDAIRKYWFNRLLSLIQIIEQRNPQMNNELARKYLTHDK